MLRIDCRLEARLLSATQPVLLALLVCGGGRHHQFGYCGAVRVRRICGCAVEAGLDWLGIRANKDTR
ncbi:hypothetical protein HRbin30_01418 [bacterium HR30]|nr:hypothetical protein HRbin30_01418 [bacterium HR30]